MPFFMVCWFLSNTLYNDFTFGFFFVMIKWECMENILKVNEKRWEKGSREELEYVS